MATVAVPYSIHGRFAGYYLNLLNTLASKLDTKNDTSFIEAISLLDEDLDQIRQAIRWLSTLASENSELARIALNFLKVNTRLFMLRLTSDELVMCTKTALEAARQFQDEETVRQCLYQLAMVYRDTGHYDESVAYSQELLASSQKGGDSRSEAKAWFILGTIDTVRSRPIQARQELENGIALLKAIGDRSEIYGQLIGSLANTYSSEGKHEIAVPLAQEALVLFREQGDLFRICYCLNNLGDDYAGLGQYSEALAAFEEGVQIARSINHNDSLALLLGNTGYISLKLGYIETAETYLEESIMVCKTMNKVVGQLLFSAILFHIRLTAQNLNETYNLLCGLMIEASELEIISVVLLLLTAFAKWFLLAGDPARSLQLLDFVTTRPELQHEGVYFAERVRHEIAASYPDLQPATPLDQSLEDIVANILSTSD
jgi:tetratricopeptide (TPR) repeat protein